MMTPPRKLPWESIASMLVAVPKSAATAAVPGERARRAMTLARRSAPGRPPCIANGEGEGTVGGQEVNGGAEGMVKEELADLVAVTEGAGDNDVGDRPGIRDDTG
jgi:hypothetical protein